SKVNWNLMAIQADGRLSDQWRMNLRLFGLLGSRDPLGNLDRIDRADIGGPRDLFADEFTNYGGELRFVHNYTAMGAPAALVLGTRFYRGLPIEGRAWGRRGTRRHFAFSILTTLRDQNMTFRETTSRCLLRTFSTSRKS